MRLRAVLSAAAVAAGLVLPAGTAVAAEPDPPPATVLTLTSSAGRLTAGTAHTLTARLTTAETGEPVPDAAVTLQRRVAGASAYTVLATVVTGADGVARLVHNPDVTADYTARHAGDATLGASSAGPVRVSVAHRVRAALNKTAARVRSEVTLTGSVQPAHPGATVRIERYSGGAWRLVTTRRLTTASTFRAVLTTPATKGWTRYRVVRPADGNNLSGVKNLPRLDSYRLHTYVVRTRGTIVVPMDRFRAAVASIYADRRGWLRGHDRFRRVARGGDFTVVLSQARYLPSYNPICSTQWSCRAGRYVVINQNRWRWGSRYFPGSLTQYRQMVVNHETGHWLGNRHAYCPGKGRPAPVMQQQSKGMQGCTPNAWPLAREL